MLSLPALVRSLWRAIRASHALNDEMDAEFRTHMELRAEAGRVRVRDGQRPDG